MGRPARPALERLLPVVEDGEGIAVIETTDDPDRPFTAWVGWRVLSVQRSGLPWRWAADELRGPIEHAVGYARGRHAVGPLIPRDVARATSS